MSYFISRFARCAVVAAVCALTSTPALGGTLKPNGNPTNNGAEDPKWGTATSTAAATKGYTVSLTPNPASFRAMGDCSWLLPALQVAALPFNNATNIWKYSFATLQGSFTLNYYMAWADKEPDVKFDGKNYPGVNRPGWGGAEFLINYNPKGTDPTTGIHWIQVIDSNQPTDRGVTYGKKLADGTTIYLDNAAKGKPGGVDPYYGALSGYALANGAGFSDGTVFDLSKRVGLDWEAQTFLTTESDTVDKGVTTHNVTIYDGVWWGFTVAAPEPSTWVQLLGGGGVIVVYGLWRRVAPRRAAA